MLTLLLESIDIWGSIYGNAQIFHIKPVFRLWFHGNKNCLSASKCLQ